MQYEFIPIVKNIQAAISQEHRFTTDSVLLSYFAAPKKNEKAAAPHSPSLSLAFWAFSSIAAFVSCAFVSIAVRLSCAFS